MKRLRGKTKMKINLRKWEKNNNNYKLKFPVLNYALSHKEEFLTSVMECGQLYDPTVLPRRKGSRYLPARKLGGPEPVWTLW
jgi:hypothetical protein